MAVKKKNSSKVVQKIRVDAITHDDATRKNIPTAEYQSIMQKADQTPIKISYERRNRDLDPQLVWRGKDQQNWSDLVLSAPPLYIQEKVHPKALIDDLLRSSQKSNPEEAQANLFADFNGLPNEGAKTEFYQHDSHWSNRMILGDSLQVMASLAEREGLRGKVQCIFFDPPYGIKFNSNFQWSTEVRDVKDGKLDHITREPEQVKAFRDTWNDGIHSYLTYMRDRLTVARDLLTDSGSIFVQIGDENVHHVQELMSEVFGDKGFVSLIPFRKRSMALATVGLPKMYDYLVWYCQDLEKLKFRPLFTANDISEDPEFALIQSEEAPGGYRRMTGAERLDKRFLADNLPSIFKRLDLCASGYTESTHFPIEWRNKKYSPRNGVSWKTSVLGMSRLTKADRLFGLAESMYYKIFHRDYPVQRITNAWNDTRGEVEKTYVVQTSSTIIERCLLMTTDPGDLVLDPTCGSGTTATVAEQFGRRWITIDTSRVALALARARVMGTRYPYYLLADSREGQLKEAEVTRTAPSSQPVHSNIRHGFVYERVPHITLKSIAHNAEVDVIWNKWQQTVEPLLDKLNVNLKQSWQDWEVPRKASSEWSEVAKKIHADWCQARIARQKEVDASIAAKAEFEFLYDKPYVDKARIRVAGPFTVESVSPHKVLGINSDDSLINESKHLPPEVAGTRNFVDVILDNLRTAGVQQAHKVDKITFTTISPWPGQMISAEGRYPEGESGQERRAAIFIGPEFGTVSRVDLVEAAKEAGDADFDVLIACAFNYDARASEFSTLGRIPVLKARMNADLHMADDLKNTAKANLFVIFGEPDIEILDAKNPKIRIKINGVDVFHPNTGEVRSDGADGIACWFIDTDYNEESFFVRHAYFLGAGDPYKSLKTSLKAEIDKEAWESLNSDTSRPFEKPKSGRIAVKVINHLGDEVMKVFKVT